MKYFLLIISFIAGCDNFSLLSSCQYDGPIPDGSVCIDQGKQFDSYTDFTTISDLAPFDSSHVVLPVCVNSTDCSGYPNYGCLGGECYPSCGQLGGFLCIPNPCPSQYVNLGQTYDCANCCK